jgi:hypothetical protein
MGRLFMESSRLLNYLSLDYGAISRLKDLLEDIVLRLFVLGFRISIGLVIIFVAIAMKLDYLLSKVGI